MNSLTPQERERLQNFLRQLVQIRGVDKNPEADALISRAVAQQPDAAYLLVQRVLLLEQALDAAKAQIAELQNQLRGSDSGGFLSGPNAWGRSAEQPPAGSALSVTGRPIPAIPASVSSSPSPAAPPSRSPGSSFLGQAAATAAGVAGGAFLFQGLESLLGHHDPASAGQHFASRDDGRDATFNDHVQPQDDSDVGDITSDSDWDTFDSGDDSSSV